ncbi:D-galacturonic acid reductase [Leucosporidium creatinivorum]|uniref:D-galacturonic acid reductase n=1 Tax=Leucosporidium creatinivorum TaxID=106004 RepID=A0A1Y2ER82_9BASI|nr:D-galacturonic acid reductase [Leucosporidium creatinivorum]
MSPAPLAVAMIGSGEYTTGYTTGSVKSDKKIGVVGLSLFDLRRRGIVGNLSIAGTSDKWGAIREHFAKNIEGVYKDMDCTFEPYPAVGAARDPDAYKAAIDALPPKSAITIFTPDSTHHAIALYAIERGHHVLVTKPATQTLADHTDLIKAAEKHGVYVCVEMHKRFDPTYADGKQKAKLIGDFTFFSSYMSQPKTQLETFAAWAGKDSDISYYLNSHHIDVHAWYLEGIAGNWRPTRVTASASTGTATSLGIADGCEDSISLLVDWESADDLSKRGTAVYTASWTAPVGAGVHSEQHFHYMGSKGEVRVNQSRRGYNVTIDGQGNSDINAFYMMYSPDAEGYFQGQHGYGYISIEKFVTTCQRVNAGEVKLSDLDKSMPTIKNTVLSGAILEAGRRSLDEKRSVNIKKVGEEWTLV